MFIIKPQIMIVGSEHYHIRFHNTEPDNEFLTSVDKLRNTLEAYNPTLICIEYEATIQDVINASFDDYNPNTFYKNEAHDLGFYLAKSLNLDSVVAIDWMDKHEDNTAFSDVYEWAKENDQSFIQLIEGSKIFHQKVSQLNDAYQTTMAFNKRDNYIKSERLYGKMMLLGNDWKTPIPWLTWWYKRNMIMVNNITKNLVTYDKVIVIVGSDHVYILKQLLEASNDFDVMTFSDWVGSE